MIKNQILAGQAGSISVVQHIQYINLYIYLYTCIYIYTEGRLSMGVNRIYYL